ncbi:MAG TPA: hypothetical protein VFZ16_05550 [Hyphomicrobiaceae bacterium]|nr:hypothetical protein [Hyphomicrobiaceae bacterium]
MGGTSIPRTGVCSWASESVSTPSANLTSISSSATWNGRRSEREKKPERRSAQSERHSSARARLLALNGQDIAGEARLDLLVAAPVIPIDVNHWDGSGDELRCFALRCFA